MTVSYNLSVSTSRPWTFVRLLFRIFKALSTNTHRRLKYIPLDWILGFFVAAVLGRFWYLYNIIGWMDNIALMTATYVRGTSERVRQTRRNIIRYCQLTQVLVFRDLSMKCRKRFPTIEAVVAEGFMMEHEKENFDNIQYRYSKYFLPFNWAWSLIYNARKEGLIESDYYVTVLSEEVRKFRTDLAWLCNYDWVPLPMIYPTIVCLAVHIYFLVCVVARKSFPTESHYGDVENIFPFMRSLQFLFYMGWLKVAEALLNPWGEDDDDFETNMLIDRNLAMGLKIVDDGYGKTPALKKDIFWDDDWVPMYSAQSAGERQYRQREGSISHVNLLKPSTTSIRMVPRGNSSAQLNNQQRRASSFRERAASVVVAMGMGRRSSQSVKERGSSAVLDTIEEAGNNQHELTRPNRLNLNAPRKNLSTPHNLDVNSLIQTPPTTQFELKDSYSSGSMTPRFQEIREVDEKERSASEETNVDEELRESARKEETKDEKSDSDKDEKP